MTTSASNLLDIEQHIHDLHAEVDHLRTRRRELTKRLRKRRFNSTHRATNILEAERKQIDERIAVLDAAARSIQQRSFVEPAPALPRTYQASAAQVATGTPSLPQTKAGAQPRARKWWALFSLARRAKPITRRARLLWTLGNLLMLVGVVLLLFVGGIYSQAEYARYAARGDNDVPAPLVISSAEPYEPAPFTAPNLSASSTSEGQVRGLVPDQTQSNHKSTISRVVIPSISVDSKVVEVGWDVQEQNGQQFAIWQVAEYAVGQHRGSANPGEGENIVLAGHVGGYGKVFKDLYYVKPGDQITLYSNGQQYLYTIQERLLVTEEGVSAQQQAENARYIAPTGQEMITLVTCWPAKGPDRFTQRVIVRAVPFGSDTHLQTLSSRWNAR